MPLAQSIGPIATALINQTVIVPVAGPVPLAPDKIPLRVGADAEGRHWVYAYTSRAFFAAALPAGSHSATVQFAALFETVDADAKLAGIILNPGSASGYPIPRSVFDQVRQVAGRPSLN